MKKILKNTIIIYLICVIDHFLYTIIPNPITSIISPTNESIFQHLKMLFISSIIYSLINYKKTSLFITLLRSTLSTFLLAIIYIPLYNIFNEVMIISLTVLFISIFITEIIISKIPNKKHYNYISAITLIILIIIFTYLTYNPIKTKIFYDEKNKTYYLSK